METAPLSPLTASPHQLHDILLTFERDLGGILGMAICDYRGKAIASTFPERTDAEELCGLVALAAGSARGTFRSLGTRGPTSSVLTGPDALLLTQDLEQARALLVAAVEKETNLGLVDLAMRATGRRLEQALLNNTPSAPRVEELFLMMRSGVLIGSTTRNSVIAKDKDLVAGMFSLVWWQKGGRCMRTTSGQTVSRPWREEKSRAIGGMSEPSRRIMRRIWICGL